jgi:hypothetical protein
VLAMCMEPPVFDLIVGNIDGFLPLDDVEKKK